MSERSRRSSLASGLAAHGHRSVIIGGALWSRTVPSRWRRTNSARPHVLWELAAALVGRTRGGVR
jgi:hypothetical protein